MYVRPINARFSVIYAGHPLCKCEMGFDDLENDTYTSDMFDEHIQLFYHK